MKKTNSNENIDSLPQTLRSVGNETPFRVPENYFEMLPISIADKISHKRETTPWIHFILKKEFIYTASLGCIIALFVIFFPIISTHFNDSNLSVSEYVIKEKYSSFDEDMLVAFLTENKEDKTSDNDYLMDYLLQNDTDINLIMEELK